MADGRDPRAEPSHFDPLAEVLRQAPLLVFAVDRQGRLAFAEGELRRGTAHAGGPSDRELADHAGPALHGGTHACLIRCEDRAFEVHYSPWHDERDRLLGALGLAVEVTERERVLASLREADARLQAVGAHASELLSELDERGRFSWVSPGHAQRLGTVPRALTGTRWTDGVHPDDRATAERFARSACATGEAFRTELRLLGRDGDVVWCDVQGQPVKRRGATPRVVMLSRDVTPEKEEEARRERARVIVERTSKLARDLIACPPGSLESHIEESLGVAGRLAGADRATLLVVTRTGRETTLRIRWSAEAGASASAGPEPGDVQRFAWALERLLVRHEVIHVPDVSALPPGATLEREAFEAHGVRSALLVPVRTRDEQTTGFVGFTRTREARGWEEAEIRALRLVVETQARAIVRLHEERALADRQHLQREIASLSRRLAAVPSDELDEALREGLSLATRVADTESAFIVFHDPRDGRALAIHRWYGRPAQAWSREASLRAVAASTWIAERLAAGETLTVRRRAELPPQAASDRVEMEARGAEAVLGVPIDLGPELSGALCTWRGEPHPGWSDEQITEVRLIGEILGGAVQRRETERALRRSEGQLAESQKMEAVGRLAGSIAHDFNNLLTVVLANAETLLDACAEHEPAWKDASEVRSAAERAAELTRNLLTFARLRPAHLETVDLNETVRGVEMLLRRTLGDRIELRLDLDPDAGCIVADAQQLQQAVIHLAINGRDAMPGGGRLTVATGRGRADRAAAERLGLAGAGPVARLEVSDEGTGIDEEARRHLFEPFFITRRVRRTAGMGLAIVYACVKELGGAVEVESGPASGTTIRLHLPPTDGPRPPERARPGDPSASVPTT